MSVLCLLLIAAFKATDKLPIGNFDTKTFVGNTKLAGIQAKNLNSKFIINRANSYLAADKITFTFKDRKLQTSAKSLGIYVDEASLNKLISKTNIEDYIRPQYLTKALSLPLTYDLRKAEYSLTKFKQDGYLAPKNAKIAVDQDTLIILEGTDGHGLNIKQELLALMSNLKNSLSPVYQTVEPTVIKPNISKADIEHSRGEIEAMISAKYIISSSKKDVNISKSDLASWLVISKSGDIVSISADKELVKQYVINHATENQTSVVNEVTTSFKSGRESIVTTAGRNGVAISNVDFIVNELYEKINSKKSANLAFVTAEVPFKKVSSVVNDTGIKGVYAYEVVVWGNVSSNINEFKALAAETLSSSLGWRASGVVFQEVRSGGNFTLILAEPARVAAASSGCSANWSCRVGRNVIINDRNWAGATPSWNAAGGSIRDYRHMVINHEVGHRLGFGHRQCGGPGQPAPVMQQQSISLQGCKFNPWPLPFEIGR